MAKQYGKWETTGNLSAGGQGTTYYAKKIDDDSEDIYVLKSLKDKRKIQRFKTEIEAGLGLDHVNILKIVDYDLDCDKPFLVSEYHSGGTLRDLDLNSLNVEEKLLIFRDICWAVGHAHVNNPKIIHRDLKPENIFLKADKATPVVGDFGICFIDNEEGVRFTLLDEAVGPARYTAPELEDGINEDITPASDVYSLGKILYWMLAGKIFEREKHNDDKWNLLLHDVSPAFVFIYDLLDQMIVVDPKKRLKDAVDAGNNVSRIINKIQNNAHALDFEAPQRCLFCGIGFYDKQIEFDHEYKRSQYDYKVAAGFIGTNTNTWQTAKLILICRTCGNEQVFRPFYLGWGTKLWKNYPPNM